MELLLATAIPPLLLWLAVMRFGPAGSDLRRAAGVFILLSLVWFSPCWLRQAAPVPLDWLTEVAPWHVLRPAGYLDKNPLLVDVPLQMMPWHEAVRRAVLAGELPLFGRHSGSGQPLWENQQAAILFPVTLAGLLFSTFGWALFSAISKVLLALIGTYVLIRTLGRSHRPAVLGAIAYAFGVFQIAFLMFPHTNVTALVPLLLVALRRIARRLDWRSSGILGLLLFAMLAGGHPESVLHAAFLAVPFAAREILHVGVARQKLRAALLMGCGGAVALLLAAPLLIPFRAYLPHAQRMVEVGRDAGFLSTPPFETQTFIPFVVPNYFGNPRAHNYRHPYNFNELVTGYAGLVTLVLAMVAAIAGARTNLFWIVLFGVMLILSTQPLPLYRFLQGLPLIGISAHARLRFVMALILAVLGAEGYEHLLEGRNATIMRAVSAAMFLLVATLCIASYPVFAQYGIRRLIFFTEIAALAGTAAIFFSARAANPALRGLLPLLLFADLFSVVGLYNPAVGRELDYPMSPAIARLRQGARPYRIAGIGRALMPNTAEYFGLEDIRLQNDPLAFAPYVALLEKAGFDRAQYFGEFHDVPKRPLLDFLGVRHVIGSPDWNRTGGLEVSYRGTDAVVLSNPGALPRYFIPLEVRGSRDPEREFLGSSDPLRVFAAGSRPVAEATVSIREYQRGKSAIDVNATGDTFLASSEVALPGWRLERDGRRWPLERINGTFLGWSAPRGTSRFVLRYAPSGFGTGWALALAGALATAAMLARPGIHPAPSPDEQ